MIGILLSRTPSHLVDRAFALFRIFASLPVERLGYERDVMPRRFRAFWQLKTHPSWSAFRDPLI